MSWKVGEAKQRFSEVLRAARECPQMVYKRDRLVAVVIDAETFKAFQSWREQQESVSLAKAFDELRDLCAAEAYSIVAPPRRDRDNPFIKALDDVSM
jgi:prevent-host-death family protein